MSDSTELATFGAGCFWGVEARFREQAGVLDVAAGYMGGETERPEYRAVCAGTTGHAEVVQIQFDPQQVEYDALLELFFAIHNPTTRNRQGPDIGSQYRSVVFYHTEAQQQRAAQFIADLDASGRWGTPVVTQLESAPTFWKAEEYHQRYLEKHGRGHCAI